MHLSLSFLTDAAITVAIFAVMVTPAITAGHDHNSTVIRDNLINSTSVAEHVCCEDPAAANRSSTPTCGICNDICNTGFTDARHMGHSLAELCRCHPKSQCPFNGYVTNDGLPETQQQWQQSWAPILSVYTFWITSVSTVCLLIVSAVYYLHTETRVHSYHVKHLTLSLAVYIYQNMLSTNDESHSLPPLLYFKPTGFLRLLVVGTTNGWQLVNSVEIYHFLKYKDDINRMCSLYKSIQKCIIYHQWTWIFLIVEKITLILLSTYSEDSMVSTSSILGVSDVNFTRFICLFPGFFSMCFSLYIFRNIPILVLDDNSSSTLFKNKILIRNLMFKISTTMWIIDVICFILDTRVKSDFIGTEILLFIKSFHGILVSYVLLYRPVLKQFLISIWKILCTRWKGNTNNQDIELAVISV